jgi:hypothetical protein
MEWLCEAKPIQSKWIGSAAKQSQSINSKGFAKQSPSIMLERLCEAKPVHHKGLTLRSKANQSKLFGFCEAKPTP